MRSAKVPRAVAGDGPFCAPPLRSDRSNVRSSVRPRRPPSLPLSLLAARSPLSRRSLPRSLGPSVRGRARSGENGRTRTRSLPRASTSTSNSLSLSLSAHARIPTISPSPKLCPPEEPTGGARLVHQLQEEYHVVFVGDGRLGAEASGLSPPHVSDPLRLRLDSAKVALHFNLQAAWGLGIHCNGVETPTPGMQSRLGFFVTFRF